MNFSESLKISFFTLLYDIDVILRYVMVTAKEKNWFVKYVRFIIVDMLV